MENLTEKFKNLLSRIKFKAHENDSEDDAEENNDDPEISEIESEQVQENLNSGGGLWALWLLILPLLVGFTLGRFAGICLGYGLDKFSGNAGVRDMSVNSLNSQNKNNNSKRGLNEFISANPFKISPMIKEEKKPEPPKQEAPKPAPEPEEDIRETLIVRATMPNIAAWVENKGKMDLIRIGKTFGKYKLTQVNYNYAVFYRGKDRYVCYISYGPLPPKKEPEKKQEAPKVTQAPKTEPAKENNKSSDGIIAAEPGQQDGQVSSEILNQLVQNPFDELKRIRMRPNEQAGGLEIQWIQNESILKRLGVQRGDVIKSVNGIPFTNMGDIANSINSLMNSERFDVEVTRGGNPTALRYVVK